MSLCFESNVRFEKKEKQRLLFSIHQHWKYGLHLSRITNRQFKLPRFCFKGLSRNTCFLLLVCVGFDLISYLYFYIFYLSCFYESFYISLDNSTNVDFFKNNRQNGFIFQLSIAPLHWQKKKCSILFTPRVRHQCNLFTAYLGITFSSNFAKEPEEVTLYLAFVSHVRTFPRHEDDGRVCVDVCNLLAVVMRLHILFGFVNIIFTACYQLGLGDTWFLTICCFFNLPTTCHVMNQGSSLPFNLE